MFSYVEELSEKYDNQMNDIFELCIYREVTENNRFLKPHIIKKIFSKEMCDSIIKEIEPQIITNHELSIKNNPNISLLTHNSLDFIMKKIKYLYNLHNNFHLKLDEYKIVKYENNQLQNNKISKSLLRIIINLSNGKEYNDISEDLKLEQGDLLIMCGAYPQIEPQIVEGVKYCIIGYIQLHIDDYDFIVI
jgi:hypothetical protein